MDIWNGWIGSNMVNLNWWPRDYKHPFFQWTLMITLVSIWSICGSCKTGIYNYEVEANRFHENNFYASEPGNILLLALLATALQFPIINFSKQNEFTDYVCYSRDRQYRSYCFCSVYTSAGPGHYDAALPCPIFVSQKMNSSNKCV